MAAYCTKADLVRRFGALELAQLTDDTTGQVVDDIEVAAVCATASSLVDAFLATRFALPLLTVPDLVKGWTEDIARYRLLKDNAGPDSSARRNYDEAMKLLRDVSRGRAGLPDALGIGADQLPSDDVEVDAPDAVFTAELFEYMP